MAEAENVVNSSEATDTSSTDSTPVETATSDDTFAGFDSEFGDETPDTDSPITADESDSNDDSEEIDDSTENGKDASTDDSDESTEETSHEELSPAEKRKEQLNSEIRDLVSQRNQLRAQVEEQNAQVYHVPSEEELQDQVNPETGEYYTTVEARLARMEQQQQLDKYNERIAEAQLTVSTEAQRALQDFPIFDSQSKEYNAEIAAQADQILQANLVQDPNTGQIVGTRVSPYQLYKSFADVWQKSQTAGAVKGQKAAEQMLSRADTPSGRTVATAKKDAFLDAFDSDEY